MKKSRLTAIINAILSVRESISDETALTVSALYPEWRDETEYSVGDRILYDGILYKCLQAHTSQNAWNPADASSLWSRVLIPDPDVIPDWIQPDSTNGYMTGDKVRYDSHVWISTIDNNVWIPGVYGWDLVE